MGALAGVTTATVQVVVGQHGETTFHVPVTVQWTSRDLRVVGVTLWRRPNAWAPAQVVDELPSPLWVPTPRPKLIVTLRRFPAMI